MGPRRASPEGAAPHTTAERVREVFAGSGFRRFFAARAVSQVGDGVFQIAAAAVLLFDDPGDAPVTKLFVVSAIVLVPFSVIAPFSGVFIDRWERRAIITWVPAARAALAAVLPLAALAGTDSIAFYTVVLLVLSANRFFLATMSAVLPQLVPEDDLIVANSVASTGGSIANVAGLGIGLVLAGALGGSSAAAIAAIAFALGAYLARRVPVHRGLEPHRAPIWDEVVEVALQLIEGLRAVQRDRRVRYAMSSIGLVQLLVGATTGALYFAFIVQLGRAPESASSVLAVLAVGIGTGVVMVPPIAERIRHDRLVPLGFLVAAAGAFFAAAGEVSALRMTVGTFFVGISYAFAKIPVDTIVQEQMPDQLRGRAFAAYDMLFNIARVSGVGVVAIAYASNAGTRTIVATIGAVYVVAAFAGSAWETAIAGARRRVIPTELLQPGEVVAVRSYAGARADTEPRAILIGGRELPIEEVEWRALVEEGGKRSRVFVCRIGGTRVRLAHREDDDMGWQIERVTAAPASQ